MPNMGELISTKPSLAAMECYPFLHNPADSTLVQTSLSIRVWQRNPLIIDLILIQELILQLSSYLTGELRQRSHYSK